MMEDDENEEVGGGRGGELGEKQIKTFEGDGNETKTKCKPHCKRLWCTLVPTGVHEINFPSK